MVNRLNNTIPGRNAPNLTTTNTISAQNTFSTPVFLYGPFIFELTGTWSGTITVQRSLDSITWNDVTTGVGAASVIAFTSNGQFIGTEPARKIYYRWGFKTGAYTSGSAIGSFEQ